jgi:hypothetical protein
VAKRGRKKARAKDVFWLSTVGGLHLEEMHAPTKDELKDLYQGLMEWRRAQPASAVSVVQPDSMGWLATLTQGPEFKQPVAMPSALWEKLHKFIRWHMLPILAWTQEQKDQLRWEYARKGIERYGWGRGFKYAADMVKGTQAEARQETIRAIYQKIEKRKPPEKRRPRTYRRRVIHKGKSDPPH